MQIKLITAIIFVLMPFLGWTQYYVASLSEGEFTDISGIANETTWDDSVNFDLGFDVEHFGEVYNGFNWRSSGRILFYKDQFELSDKADTIVRVNVYNDYLNSLYSNEKLKYASITLGEEQIFVLQLQNVRQLLTAKQNSDSILDSLFLDIELKIFQNGDITIIFDQVKDDIDKSKLSQNYRVGIAKFSFNEDGIDTVYLGNTSLAMSDITLPFFGQNFPYDVISDYVYSGLQVDLSPNKTFLLGNYNVDLNHKLMHKDYRVPVYPGGEDLLSLFGFNHFFDQEFATKFQSRYPMNINGIAMQNYGDSSLSYGQLYIQIMNQDSLGRPGSVFYSDSIHMSCLKLNGDLNYFYFDSIVPLPDNAFFVNIVLPEYTIDDANKFGLYFQNLSSDYYSTLLRQDDWFSSMKLNNGNWYSQSKDKLVTERFSRSFDDNNIVTPAIFPIVQQRKGKRQPDQTPLCLLNSVPQHSVDSEVKVFPNPAADKLNIQSEDKISQISMYSLTGELLSNVIVQSNQHVVYLEELDPQVIIVKVVLMSGLIKSFIVQNE